jgi:hypothetical protein
MRSHYVYYSYEEYGRGYIGSRSCNRLPEEDVNYYGSYTDKSFKPTQKIILGVYETAEDSLEGENILMEFYQVGMNPHFINKQISPYNHKRVVCRGANNGMYGRTHTEEAREKISRAATGRTVSEETRQKMSQSQTGKKRTSGAAISKALKGRVFTDDHKAKLSKAMSKPSGRKMSYEQKKKMYEARWGRPYEEMLKDK